MPRCKVIPVILQVLLPDSANLIGNSQPSSYETLPIATTCSARVEDSEMPSPLPPRYSDVEAIVHR
jgi:hypothetical protein